MLFRRKGLDKNFAQKQKWWTDISSLIDTDDETKRRIVSYIYEEVSRGKIGELDWLESLFTAGESIVDVQLDLGVRRRLIVEYVKKPPKT